jgi:hypothetical protein
MELLAMAPDYKVLIESSEVRLCGERMDCPGSIELPFQSYHFGLLFV